MKHLIKPSLVIGLSASVASTPFVLLLAEGTQRSTTSLAAQILYSSPLLLAVVAIVWFLCICSVVPRLWLTLAPVVGALTGLLTFVTFGVGYGWGSVLLLGMPFAEAFNSVAGMGLLLFGWVPIVVGGGAAWLGHRLYAPEG